MHKHPIIVWDPRFWPYLAGAVLVLGISSGLWWYAISGIGRAPESASESGFVTTPPQVQPHLVPRALDGVLVDPALADLSAFAVMIDNQADARPQSGLSSASMVFEIPVEGGLTRFMALFDASSTASEIGPVRSARLYYVDIAAAYRMNYTHVGGSPEALEKISALSGFADANEYFNGNSFWRSSRRSAPHNVYTSMELLNALAEKKEWQTPVRAWWKFLPSDATSTVPTSTEDVVVDYPAVPLIRWSFDRDAEKYARYMGKERVKEFSGAEVFATNVIVLETDGKVLDSAGRLQLRTTGSGKMILHRGGRSYRGVWRRTSGEPFRLESIDGSDVYLAPGTTWIQVVMKDANTE